MKVGVTGIVVLSTLSAGCTNENVTYTTPGLNQSFGEPSDADFEDVFLAVFTNSENDSTDTFYSSVDGMHFEKISEAFVNLDPANPDDLRAVGSGTESSPYDLGGGLKRTWPLYAFKCPSLIWHNGYFWILSNESNSGADGTLRLVISNSKDLVHWCDQRQVKIEVPVGFVENGTAGQFDAVAADWNVGLDGNIYVAVSIGSYGEFHGNPEEDTMYPYLVKITELSATNDPAVNPLLNDSNFIKVDAQPAQPINLPLASTNRIDGSLYFDNEFAYLSIKENGVTDEIWRIADLSNISSQEAWTLVNGDVITGYEAPCLAKINETYFFYTDEISSWTPDDHVRQPYYSTGTFVQWSKDLSADWSSEQLICAYDADYKILTLNTYNNANGDGPRHGTVFLVTDPAAKEIVWKQRNSYGWTLAPVRFTDPDLAIPGNIMSVYAGENRYMTANLIANAVADAGTYEGVIVASGANGKFADALCASGLSGVLNYPIVLVDGSGSYLNEETAGIISRLVDGKGEIIVLGGTETICDDIADGLAFFDINGGVERIAGEDRYDTAEKIYRFGSSRGVWSSEYAVLAKGNDFPDALGAASFCASNKVPMLLTNQNTEQLSDYISDAAKAVSQVVIVGGTLSVSQQKEDELKKYSNVVRFGESTRYGTNFAFANWQLSHDMSIESAGIATGVTFPDALGSSFLLSLTKSVLLLTSKTEFENTAIYALLSDRASSITEVNVFGGENSVSAETRSAVQSVCGTWEIVNK